MFVEIMRNISDVPRPISGTPLLKNTHHAGGMFVGKYVGGDGEGVTGVNMPTKVEIVLVEANPRQSPTCSTAGCSIEGFGFIVRPSIGKIFASDADPKVVDFYRYLPLICARVSIKGADEWRASKDHRDGGGDARITLFGNVLHVEHFLDPKAIVSVAQSLRMSRICVLQINTLAFLVPDARGEKCTEYFYSDLIGDKQHETINGKASYFFDERISQLGYDLRASEQFALNLNECQYATSCATLPAADVHDVFGG
ncbi:hypothetical protein LMG27198_18210 [Methylocystis echinoides]|uniref:Uncharacterized protein n=2 Tax=Methylocystis echinoides TaxID=29468 RepID=A0A9W6LS02_9HYPH|nr:hypothetical protein LMG27198_18210 [Methylocystis echinoides]